MTSLPAVKIRSVASLVIGTSASAPSQVLQKHVTPEPTPSSFVDMRLILVQHAERRHDPSPFKHLMARLRSDGPLEAIELEETRIRCVGVPVKRDAAKHAGHAFAKLTVADRHPVDTEYLRSEAGRLIADRRLPAERRLGGEAAAILETWATRRKADGALR